MSQASHTMEKPSTNKVKEPANTVEKDKPSSAIRKERAERLKHLRELTRLSRQQFAKHYKLPYGSLQNWEDPKYGGLTKTGAPRVIAALKEEGIFVSMGWLLYGKDPAPYVSVSALLERMNIRQNANTVANESVIIGEELGLFKHHYKEALEATVADNAMSPAFEKNDQVAGKKFSPSQAASLVGKICIVMTENKQTLVRKLEAGSQPNRYNLVSINPNAKSATIKNAAILSVAPILWMRRPQTTQQQ